MTQQEIQQIIEERNEREQRAMCSEAHGLIERIAQLQQTKADADAEIAKCREALKALSVKPLTPAELLGGAL